MNALTHPFHDCNGIRMLLEFLATLRSNAGH